MTFTSFPKPVKAERQRRPMRRSAKRINRVGPVTKHRLKIVAELTKVATEEGWLNTCEVGRVLRNLGITFVRCLGDLEFAHSVKCSPRGYDPMLDLKSQEAVNCITIRILTNSSQR